MASRAPWTLVGLLLASLVAVRIRPDAHLGLKRGPGPKLTTNTAVSTVASFGGAKLQADLSNLENLATLPALTARQKELLGQDGMIPVAGEHLDFFQSYINNSNPFVTSDALLHCFHILCEDTLQNWERLVVIPFIDDCSLYCLPQLKSDPKGREIWERIHQLATSKQPRQTLQVLSQTSLDLEKEEELGCALRLTYALAQDPQRWQQWLHLEEWFVWLAGQPEDLSPSSLLALAQPIFGREKPNLSRDNKLALKAKLASLPRPVVEDQDHPHGLSFRLCPPGLTAKNRIVQLHFKQLRDGQMHPAQVLPEILQTRQDRTFHGATLDCLAQLDGLSAWGCVKGANWKLKSTNTQLGAWCQLEHTLGGYAKDNEDYLGGYHRKYEFSGYVEPNPQFYRKLARLTGEFRRQFENDGLLAASYQDFRKTDAIERQALMEKSRGYSKNPEAMYGQPRPCIVATSAHFGQLESLLLQLADMADLEMADQPFQPRHKKLLTDFAETLKHLSLNESNVDEPPGPLGQTALLAQFNSQRWEQHLCIGRPNEILTIVPYDGKLYWCKGAIFSVYFPQTPTELQWDDQLCQKLTSIPHDLSGSRHCRLAWECHDWMKESGTGTRNHREQVPPHALPWEEYLRLIAHAKPWWPVTDGSENPDIREGMMAGLSLSHLHWLQRLGVAAVLAGRPEGQQAARMSLEKLCKGPIDITAGEARLQLFLSLWLLGQAAEPLDPSLLEKLRARLDQKELQPLLESLDLLHGSKQ